MTSHVHTGKFSPDGKTGIVVLAEFVWQQQQLTAGKKHSKNKRSTSYITFFNSPVIIKQMSWMVKIKSEIKPWNKKKRNEMKPWNKKKEWNHEKDMEKLAVYGTDKMYGMLQIT